MPWTVAHLPRLDGHVVVVTGATSGLGLEATRALARVGAHVVLATRDATKTATVMDRLRDAQADASLEHVELDLADLDSVADAAETILDRHERIDRLINNAGVMAPPLRRTAQGFELQLGVNHLGHFALTCRLLPRLVETDGARVVTVASGLSRLGDFDWDDLNWERGYSRWRAYGRSKLANLVFAIELDRRLRAAGHDVLSLASHPGYAATHLQFAGTGMDGGLRARVAGTIAKVVNAAVAQDAAAGALPTLYAASSDEVVGGGYYGPDRLAETRGHPAPAAVRPLARDPDVGRRLWAASEELTGVTAPLPAP